MVRVFLLDDHEVVRRGVRELLEAEDDIDVVGEAGTAEEALQRGSRRPSPTSPCSTCGCPTAAASRCAATSARSTRRSRCLMLTSFADDEALFDAIMAGAAGYVLKQIRAATSSTRPTRRGAASRCSTRRDRAGDRAAPAPAATTSAWRQLTAQERRILDLIAEGLTNRQIGERMFLAEKTVKNYVSNLLQARHEPATPRRRSTPPGWPTAAVTPP